MFTIYGVKRQICKMSNSLVFEFGPGAGNYYFKIENFDL